MLPCKILLVEDSLDVRAAFRAILEQEGFRVAVSQDGPSMRQALEQTDIDVVIIDVALPGGENGLALADEVARSGFAVILVTGHPGYFEAVEKSGHRHLFKPFRMEALLGMVARVRRELDGRNAGKR